MKTKKMLGFTGKSATPNEAQLSAINSYAIETLSSAEVYVRTMNLAHNAIDRDKEVMDAPLLQDFARTLPGKGLFIKHPMSFDGDTGPGEGRFFEAGVREMGFDEARQTLREPSLQWPPGVDKALLLEASFYAVRTNDNEALLAKIDAGVAGDVSIGFSASDRTPILDGNEQRIATRLHGPGEAYEASLVWLGAQPGARITKAAGNDEGTHKPHNDPVPCIDALSLQSTSPIGTLKDLQCVHRLLSVGDEKTTMPYHSPFFHKQAAHGRTNKTPNSEIDPNPLRNPLITG